MTLPFVDQAAMYNELASLPFNSANIGGGALGTGWGIGPPWHAFASWSLLTMQNKPVPVYICPSDPGAVS